VVEIVDGTGSGKRAQVDDKNRLVTNAITKTEEHFVSLEEEGSYFLSVGQNINSLTIGAAGTAIYAFLQSLETTKKVVIQNIFVASDTDGVVLKIVKNLTIGTLTQNTPTIPENLNFSSTATVVANAQIWDEAGGNGIQGLTLGADVKSYILAIGNTVLPIEGSMILDQNDNIGLEVNNPTGGAAEVEVGIRFYLE